MFGLSAGHLIILGVVVLLFGGKRIPELGASLGKGMRAFKNSIEGRDVELDSHKEERPLLTEKK